MNDEMNTPQPQSDDQTNMPSTEEGTTPEVTTEVPKTEEGTGTEGTEETKTDETPATE